MFVRTCRAAGELALAQHAAEEAVGFLETAALAAASPGFTPEPGCAPDAAFSGTLGQVYLRTGRLAEARARLEEALAAETDVMRRAALWAWLCEVHHSRYEADLIRSEL